MHAASVYPEPGSNSPKRCTTLRPRLLSEGLTTRTSLSRISCHSSVVKVQRPRRDGPRRRPQMMGLGGRGVKPADRVVPVTRVPRNDLRGGVARANGMGGGRVVSNAPGWRSPREVVVVDDVCCALPSLRRLGGSSPSSTVARVGRGARSATLARPVRGSRRGEVRAGLESPQRRGSFVGGKASSRMGTVDSHNTSEARIRQVSPPTVVRSGSSPRAG